MIRVCIALALSLSRGSVVAAMETMWSEGNPTIRLIGPALSGETQNIVQKTLNRYFRDVFGWEIPIADELDSSAVNLVVGNASNNESLKLLVATGIVLNADELGDEGFQIFSDEVDGSRVLVIAANTPQGLKHGCQELMYFRTTANPHRVDVDWPINVAMKPQIPYRGIYMLPIWSAYDSLDSWRKVLRFNSELTLNRIWFWLDGFPVAGHPVSAHGTDYRLERTVLAKDENVQMLIDLANSEGMKFYIGGAG